MKSSHTRPFRKSCITAGVLVFVFFLVAFYIRVVIPYPDVFTGEWVKFTGMDAWYYMRIIDNLVHNFPYLNQFDPYLLYSGEFPTNTFPFFSYVVAGIIWMLGLGSPNQGLTNIVGAYFPAVIGALMVVPVYFIGRAFFSRWAGVIAAGLIAVTSGEYLGRSILGYTDHHIWEVFCVTISMLFLVMAIKAAKHKGLTLAHIRHGDWDTVKYPTVFAVCAGLFLGMYLSSWLGALLFVFILFVYFVLQFIIDHLLGQSTEYLALPGVLTFAVALLVFLPFSMGNLTYLVPVIIGLITPVLMVMISKFMIAQKWKPSYYLVIVIGAGLASLLALYLLKPAVLQDMWNLVEYINPAGTRLTTLEGQRILFPGGQFSLEVIWGNFQLSIVLALTALGLLIYQAVKKPDAAKVLLIVWTILIMVAMLSMRRFAYYFAVNSALLCAYGIWSALLAAGLQKRLIAVQSTVSLADNQHYSTLRKAQGKTGRKKQTHRADGKIEGSGKRIGGAVLISVLVVVLSIVRNPRAAISRMPRFVHVGILAMLIIVVPMVLSAVPTAKPAYTPSNAWMESLTWLKQKTPETFPVDKFGRDFYYGKYQSPFPWTRSMPGVAAWWDFGYWISRVGQRAPVCNPGGGFRTEVARLFTATKEYSGYTTGATSDNDPYIAARQPKYIIIDFDTAVITNKYWAVMEYAGVPREQFGDIFYKAEQGLLIPVIYYFPDYYRSFAVRLYNFDAEKVVPSTTTVIAYEDRVANGKSYKVLVESRSFTTYENAVNYMENQKSGNYRIVGTDPFISPVPLDALNWYRLIYSSKDGKMYSNTGKIPEVKIFEHLDKTQVPASVPY